VRLCGPGITAYPRLLRGDLTVNPEIAYGAGATPRVSWHRLDAPGWITPPCETLRPIAHATVVADRCEGDGAARREVVRPMCPSPDGSRRPPFPGVANAPNGGRASLPAGSGQPKPRVIDNRETPRGTTPRPEAPGCENTALRRIRRHGPTPRLRERPPSVHGGGGQWYPRESDQLRPRDRRGRGGARKYPGPGAVAGQFDRTAYQPTSGFRSPR